MDRKVCSSVWSCDINILHGWVWWFSHYWHTILRASVANNELKWSLRASALLLGEVAIPLDVSSSLIPVYSCLQNLIYFQKGLFPFELDTSGIKTARKIAIALILLFQSCSNMMLEWLKFLPVRGTTFGSTLLSCIFIISSKSILSDEQLSQGDV